MDCYGIALAVSLQQILGLIGEGGGPPLFGTRVTSGGLATSPSTTSLAPTIGLNEMGGMYLFVARGSNGADVSLSGSPTTPESDLFNVSPGTAFITLRGWARRGGASNTSRSASLSRTTGSTGANGSAIACGVRHWGGVIEAMTTQAQVYSASDTTASTPAIAASSGADRTHVMVLAAAKQNGVGSSSLSIPTFVGWQLATSIIGALGIYTAPGSSAVASESFSLPAGNNLAFALFDLVPAH